MIRKLFFLIVLQCCLSTQAAYIPAEDIFNNTAYQAIKISPDGRHMLAQAYLDDRTKLLVLKSSILKAVEIFDDVFERASVSIDDFGWLDNDSIYVTFSGRWVTQRTRIIHLTSDDFDIDFFDLNHLGWVVSPLRDEENRILFAALNKKRNGYHLYRVNVDKLRDIKNLADHFEKIRPTSDERYDHMVWFHVDASKQLKIFKEHEEGEQRIFVFDEQNKKWLNIFTIPPNDERKEDERLDTFFPVSVYDKDRIVVISNIDRDKSAVRVYNFRSKSFEQTMYESPLYDVVGAIFDSERKSLAQVFYVEKGVRRIKYLNEENAQNQSYLRKALDADEVFTIARSSDNLHHVLMTTSSAKTAEFYYFDVKNKKTRFLQNSMPALHDAPFAKGEVIQATAEDGILLEGYLTLPLSASKQPAPLIVMPHGGPIGVRDFHDFDQEVQFLANRGFGVLRVNFRGSSGYGKKHLNAGREQLGQDIEKDINLVVEKVLQDKRINKKQLCIYGISYGGYSALMSAIRYPEKYRCAISAFGVTDLPLLFNSLNHGQLKEFRERIEWVVGKLEKNPEKYKEFSPVYNVERLNVPVLLISGDADEVAINEHSDRLAYVMKHYGKSVEHISYKTQHGHRLWSGDRHHYLSVVEFLYKQFAMSPDLSGENKRTIGKEMYLLGEMYGDGKYVVQDKAKAEQYLRKAHQYGHPDAAKALRTIGVYNF